MQTLSHLLINGVTGLRLDRQTSQVGYLPFVLGGLLPDLPFALLTLGGEIYYRWFAPLPVTGMSVMEYLHFDLFFNSPWWIVPHNSAHAPLLLGVLIASGWFARHLGRSWGTALQYLGLGMLLHTALDVLTHTTDGPLLFFPLNWSYRFESPVSYWEAANFGQLFIIFEILLDILLIGILWSRRQSAISWWRQRKST